MHNSYDKNLSDTLTKINQLRSKIWQKLKGKILAELAHSILDKNLLVIDCQLNNNFLPLFSVPGAPLRETNSGVR